MKEFRNKRGYDIEFDEDINELSKLNLPDPGTLDYYNQIKNREIYWNRDIYDDLVDMSLKIIEWNKEDKGKDVENRKPIKVFINSDGGDVSAVMNFINTIQLSKTPVITIGMGKVYSSGGLLLMAGHTRLIFEDTTCLIHDGSTGAIGNVGKVLDSFEFTQKQEKRIKDYILSRTKIKEEDYDKNYRRDWFLFADEMIELGVADKIITDIEEIF